MAASTTMNSSCCRSRASGSFPSVLKDFAALCHGHGRAFKTLPVLELKRQRGSIREVQQRSRMRAYLLDILAVGFFALEWAVYAYTLERSSYGRDSLSARMH